MDSGKRDTHKTHKPIKTYLFRKTLIKMQYRMTGTAERGRYRNSSGSPRASLRTKERNIIMENVEMIEELRKNADISYQTASEVLEGTDWNLDAAKSALKKEGIYREETLAMTTTNNNDYTKTNTNGSTKESVKSTLRKFADWSKDKITRGLRNDFCVETKGGKRFTMPVTIMVILSILLIEFVPILFIIGFFMGCRFTFEGPDLSGTKFSEEVSKIRFDCESRN